jgi:dolichol-phosphate mannosyltransferase
VGADAPVYKCDKERQTRAACDRADRDGLFEAAETQPSIERLWRKVEMSRDRSWQHNPGGFSTGLRRRASLAARSLPVLPGRPVLELGGGSGVWTEYLADAFCGLNPITSAVFNEDLAHQAQSRKLPGTSFIHIRDFRKAFPPESFDYIVGTDIVTDSLCPAMLEMAFRCLKPGGQLFFLAQNASHPFTIFRKAIKRATGRDHFLRVQQGVSLRVWSDAAVCQGFSGIEITPSEVIPPFESSAGQAIGLILDRAPVVRGFSKVVSFRAIKPAPFGMEDVPAINLATHRQLFNAVSVVVPCHNEEANIVRLVKTMLGMYGDYIHEIVIVDDNSTDGTARVAADVASTEPRVKLVKRNPPCGVGRALRDGYAAASGRYIFSIDCDFITIAPEFKGLFDAVAEGYEGAIGSRFSSHSALVRYPLSKILCNRGYHLMLNLLLGKRVRDISNNLKLYRAEILKNLDIEADGFAANVETGLEPLLLNCRICEVSTSWINRTPGMGKSSFSLLKVGPDYLVVLLRTAWRYWRGQYRIAN